MTFRLVSLVPNDDGPQFVPQFLVGIEKLAKDESGVPILPRGCVGAPEFHSYVDELIGELEKLRSEASEVYSGYLGR